MANSERELSIVPRTHGLIVREIEGEIVVLDSSADVVHQLNGTASIIWRLASEGASRGDIAAFLVQYFDVSEERALRDVDQAIGEFASLDLIELES